MQDTKETKNLIKKIKILMVVRLVLVTAVMAAGPFVLRVERIPFYYIIAIFYFVTFIYALLIRLNLPFYFNAYLQIIVDIFLVTVIMHFAGGAESLYVLLYAPSIIASGVIISGRAAKTIAGLSSIFYAIIAGLEFFGLIGPVYGAETYTKGVYSLLFIVSFRIILFCLIGYLSSYLSLELHKEHIELIRLRNLSDIILRNISSGVITLNASRLVIYANPAARKILERTGKEITGAYLRDLIFDKGDDDTVDQFIKQSKSSGGKELIIQIPAGEKLILNCSYADITDEKNEIKGGVLTFVDISPLKALEMEICQREKLSAMGETAVSIAHEIRNPVASIRGALEVLKEKGRFQGEGEKLVDVIFKESDRLNRILEDFLKYAKGHRSGFNCEDLGELIDEVWLLIKQGEKWHKGIILEKRLNPPRIGLKINSDHVKQVLYNLFINALDACSNKPQAEICIDAGEAIHEVTIIIKDTGVGIPKDEQDKLFKHFHSTKSSGMGMGLAITRKIIESYNGRIELQSEEGKGTIVTIILPK